MSKEPHEIHNELAPEILSMIAKGVSSPVDRMVLMESILAGLCMLIAKQNQKDPMEVATIVLESLVVNLPERINNMQKKGLN